MGYNKVYYDDILAADTAIESLYNNWNDDLEGLRDKLERISKCDQMKGAAAESIKTYLQEVPLAVTNMLDMICFDLRHFHALYYYGYSTQVDEGDGTKYGSRYTTILASEIQKPQGTVHQRLNSLANMLSEDSATVAGIENSARKYLTLPKIPFSNMFAALQSAKNIASNFDRAVNDYEASHLHDLDNVKELMAQVSSIINHQLNENRTASVAYQSGGVNSMCDFFKTHQAIYGCISQCADGIESGDLEKALNFSAQQQALVEEERLEKEKENRKWAKYAAVGLCAIGSIALIVVTAGAATPLVAAGVGAVVGAGSVAVTKLADEYYEHGNLDQMNWDEFAKDCLVGGVTGFIAGGVGATSFSRGIKGAADVAKLAFATGASKAGAEGIINTTYDVANAIKDGKSFNEVLDTAEDSVKDMLLGTVKDGVTGFAGAYVSESFDVRFNTGNKERGFWFNFGEGVIKSTTEAATALAVDSTAILGECLVSPDSSKTLWETFQGKANDQEILKNFGKSFAEGLVDSAVEAGGKKISGKLPSKGVGKKAGRFGIAVGQGVLSEAGKGISDYLIDQGKIPLTKEELSDFLKNYMDEGRGIISSGANAYGKALAKDFKMSGRLKQSDENKDGKIDVVTFDNIPKVAVLKEDYEAAVSLAGTSGAYKNKTVEQILGLDKKIDQTKIRERKYSIGSVKKGKVPLETKATWVSRTRKTSKDKK